MGNKTTRIRLVARPVGEPRDGDFDISTAELPELADGQVLLRTIYLSLDPYMRGRMSAAESYADPVELGDVMIGGTVCEVLESRSPNRAAGDLVLAFTGWQTHAVADARHTRRLDPATAPISTALGVLGMPGLTAYAGLLDIGKPEPGQTVVVAAASGPVGSAVGQIAKLEGARAVGIAGGPVKCRALIEEFGFDAAVDHRSPTFAADLEAATSDGIDVYFENVGGPVTEAVVDRLNPFARIPVCGVVSGYNRIDASAGTDRLDLSGMLWQILTRSLSVRGFIVEEFVPTRQPDFLRDMAGWVAEGAVRYREDIIDGLERAPEAFRGLLAGRNFGKLLIRVGDDPTRNRG
ncbi:NADP-dependent oxidoreductase [Nocardia nova]|uniref:NADP-dependent oxidoreductase n=1 Tax=Nocardia nova TaxID=37330 RepID=UPI0033EB9A20